MKVEIYKRADGKWAWRAVAGNGRVIATDGGQGYENRTDAVDMVHVIFSDTHNVDITFSTE